MSKIPREVHISYVRDHRTGGTHNVLEVCSKDSGVRFVMAQDAETAKERDIYKLRAHLQAERIAELEARIEELEADKQRLWDSIEAGESVYKRKCKALEAKLDECKQVSNAHCLQAENYRVELAALEGE